MKEAVITLEQYAELIGYQGEILTLEAIQEYAEDELDETIWDYPLEEIDDMESDYVLVQTEFGIRACEII